MRNDLLADIVVAAGGVVTNKGNRNVLLQDWLNAVESPPAVNYVARLDGVSQYWRFSEAIGMPIGYSLSFELYRPISSSGRDDYLLSNESDTSTALVYGGGERIFVGSSGYLQNLQIDGDGNSNFLPPDDSFHNVSVESNNNLTSVINIGARFNIERLLLGFVKNIIVRDSNGVIVNEIPLTNRAQGATQLPTVGNVSATMIGYTGDEWEEL